MLMKFQNISRNIHQCKYTSFLFKYLRGHLTDPTTANCHIFLRLAYFWFVAEKGSEREREITRLSDLMRKVWRNNRVFNHL